jgi:hypothetical protein
VLQSVVTHFPYFLLIWSFCEPYSLPNSVKVEVTKVGRVQIKKQALNRGSIFDNLISELKMLFDKKFAIQITLAVLKGENLFHMMRGFLNILARVKSEEGDKAFVK